MKNLTKALSIIIVMALVLVAPMSVFAAANPGDIPPEWQIEQNSDVYSEGHTVSRATLQGKCSITKLSSTSVTISATSNANIDTLMLRATVGIEYFKDGKWQAYPDGVSYSNAVGFGKSVTASGNVTVTPGYYYRAAGLHTGGDFSAMNTVSSSIYVS